MRHHEGALKYEMLLFIVFLLTVSLSRDSFGQEINTQGWPVPHLKGLIPYYMVIQRVDGVEKLTEKFYSREAGHVARVSGNGRVFAYVVDHDIDPPIDYVIMDQDGSGKFTHRYGPDHVYSIPAWVSY